jgi:hypothetical protein
MNKAIWAGATAGLTLVILSMWWFLSNVSANANAPDEPVRAIETETPPVVPIHSPEELRAAAERSIAEVQERMRLAAQDQDPNADVITLSRRSQRQSEVQRSPSYFSGFSFSELPRERRRMALAFNRRASEAHIIRDLGGPNAESIYNVTLLVLSRAIVHEANWVHRPCGSGLGEFHTACDTALDHNHSEFDGPAMYAVFRSTRATGMTLLGSIRNHMRYVTEEEPPPNEHSRWISELTLDGARPRHFPATDAEGNPINWERDYQPRWLQVVEMSRHLLNGEGLGMCASAPLVTWGGRCEDRNGACDDHHGSHRGLVGMSCGDSSNRFWCRPGTRGCVESDPIPVQPTVEVASLEAPESIVEAPTASESPEPIEAPEAPATEEDSSDETTGLPEFASL